MKSNTILSTLAPKTLLATALAAASAVSLSDPLVLEEVIVTAQKREQSVQDVPSSMVAVSSEQLSLTNTSDFSDLSKITAGIAINNTEGGVFPTMRIRGVGSNRFTPGIRPSVTVFLNEVPLSQPEAAFNNMADVERIEVLKGPQATLFGKGVSSGAFNIFTRKPATEEIEGFLEANIGENDLQEYRGGLNLPLGEDMAIRGSAYSAGRDGQISNVVTGKESDLDTWGGRIEALARAGDSFQAILGYEKHEKELRDAVSEFAEYGEFSLILAETNGVTLPPEDPYDDKTYTVLPNSRDNDTEIWSLRMSVDLNDQWSLNSISSHQEWESETVAPGGQSSPFATLRSDNTQGIETDTQELRLNFEGDKLSSVIGAYYSDSDRVSYSDVYNTVAVSPGGESLVLAIEVLQDESIEDIAVFSHNIYHLRDSLDIIFGLRYQETDKDSVQSQKYGQGEFADAQAPFFTVSTWDAPKQNDSWSAWTGTFKINYTLMEDLSVYAGYDRGYKAGGFNLAKPVSAISGRDEEYVLSEPFDEQTGENYEIGVKSELLDRRLRLNASIFYQPYDDFQVEIPDELGPGNTVINAASLDSTGVELDFAWLASAQLMVDGSLAYVDAEWDEFDNASCNAQQLQGVSPGCVDGFQDLSGEQFHGNNEWTANLNVTWTRSFGMGMEWFVRGEAAYRDELIGMADHDSRSFADSYTLYNASTGIRADSWRITLWGKNLGDEDYTTIYSQGRDGDPRTGSYGIYHAATPGRTYGVNARYMF